jgi:hypothetical protein
LRFDFMDNDSIRRSILSHVDEVVSRLACALTVASSRSLQSEIRRFASLPPDGAFAARLPSSYCWVVANDPARGPLREPPRDVPHVELDVPFDLGGPLRKSLEEATDEVGGFRHAYGMLTPVFDVAASLNRAQMDDLIKWAPTFEQEATRISVLGILLIDALRKDALAGLDTPGADAERRVQEYAGLLRMIADLQLLASDDGARPWLEGMAKSFEWQRWTPSWQLVRERLIEFLPAAAWSVQAFGPSIIDGYLGALVRSNHPMLVFDALFGLISLALSAPAEAPAILSEIKNRRAFIETPVASERELVNWLVTAALEVIEGPDKIRSRLAERFGFRGALQPGRLLPRILADTREHDPAHPLIGESMPLAFALLPVILEGNRIDAYPEAPMGDLATERIVDALVRAWGAAARPRAVIH